MSLVNFSCSSISPRAFLCNVSWVGIPSASNTHSIRLTKCWLGEGSSLLQVTLFSSEYSLELVALSLRYLPGKTSSASLLKGSNHSSFWPWTCLVSWVHWPSWSLSPEDLHGFPVVLWNLLLKSCDAKGFITSTCNLLSCNSLIDSVDLSAHLNASNVLTVVTGSFPRKGPGCNSWCKSFEYELESFSLWMDNSSLCASLSDCLVTLFAEGSAPEK